MNKITGNISEEKDLMEITNELINELALDEEEIKKKFMKKAILKADKILLEDLIRFCTMNNLKVVLDFPNDEIAIYYEPFVLDDFKKEPIKEEKSPEQDKPETRDKITNEPEDLEFD